MPEASETGRESFPSDDLPGGEKANIMNQCGYGTPRAMSTDPVTIIAYPSLPGSAFLVV